VGINARSTGKGVVEEEVKKNVGQEGEGTITLAAER